MRVALALGVLMTLAPLAGPSAESGVVSASSQDASPQRLRFSVPEGRLHNEFLREGPIAAHLVLSDGPAPRLVVAFPAGNSGAALWFDAAQPATWGSEVALEAVERRLPEGVLRGVTAEITLTGAPVTIRHAITSSIRVIRDYGYTGETPPEVLAKPQRSERSVVWQRPRLDGAAGYYLSIEMLEGGLAGGADGELALVPASGETLRLRVTALTGDPPLEPIDADALLTPSAKPDRQLRDALAFLSYEGKLLAGSWRFNTYFGRDTLMSVKLLMPVLQPGVVEAGLGAVLDRLDANGEVAHEEDIGEYAVLRRLRRGEAASAAPIYDYKMIDDDFLLPLVAADYLLATPAGRGRAAQFLARTTPAGESYGAALFRNCRFVIAAASTFAQDPRWRNLIRLKPGETAGNWRDSDAGLGGGAYPYDVNAVLVPGALRAIARLHESGLLQGLAPADEAALSAANAMADAWLRAAPGFFAVRLDPATARAEVESYARGVGVDPTPALRALPNEALQFQAIALDAEGAPLPVLHSDAGFALLFLDPPAAEVERIATTLLRPFPAGLMTGAGLVVANPAYAAESIEPAFDRSLYHGTTIWSWQQALLASGIARQQARGDLTDAARESLGRAHDELCAAMEAAHAVRGSELWSWSYANGRYRIEPFGQRSGDETESNAAQLWSTIELVPLCPPDPAAE